MPVQHPALSECEAITHGFFTRNGGASGDAYQSLNCGYGSSDDPERVRKNRAIVAQRLNVADTHLVTAHQIHSPDAIFVTEPYKREDAPKADALVTNSPNLAIAVLTADCGPLLFADSKNRVIAAAHAGWRGAFGGVIETTLDMMQHHGAQKDQITAVLGPTISQPNYEVDQAFRDQFVSKAPSTEVFFKSGQRNGHHLFDLPAYIMSRLKQAGIEKAYNLNRCTYAENHEFFSYRRSTHQNEPDYGRQLSAIALCET